ncbi:MAG TPA: hypothetical protein VGR71_06140, partial [Nitrospira sp.]|nr:hypothetical protein [Nitrospira sp.]
MENAQNLTFIQAQLTAIADALGHTDEGLTGAEIEHLLAICRIKDTHPDLTKRYRVFNALANDQNTRGNRKGILAFIRHAMKPERFVRLPGRFESLRTRLNQALLFAGLIVVESGELEKTEAART